MSALECSWCILEKKKIIGEVLDALERVDPDLVHLDFFSGGIKFQSLWFFYRSSFG